MRTRFTRKATVVVAAVAVPALILVTLMGGGLTAASGREATTDWSVTTVDASENVDAGWWTAGASFEGRNYVFYSDDAVVKYAWSDDNTHWETAVLDGLKVPSVRGSVYRSMGDEISAVATGRGLHVFYGDTMENVIRHAAFDGRRWTVSVLDGRGGWKGEVAGATGWDIKTIDFAGEVNVFYGHVPPGQDRDEAMVLRRAHGSEGATGKIGWSFETLDGPGGSALFATDDAVGFSISVVGDQGSGLLHVFARHWVSAGTSYVRHLFSSAVATWWFAEDIPNSNLGLMEEEYSRILSAALTGGNVHVFLTDGAGDTWVATADRLGWDPNFYLPTWQVDGPVAATGGTNLGWLATIDSAPGDSCFVGDAVLVSDDSELSLFQYEGSNWVAERVASTTANSLPAGFAEEDEGLHVIFSDFGEEVDGSVIQHAYRDTCS